MSPCTNGDGRRVHARGLCAPCYQRATYRGQLPPRANSPTDRSWPGIAVSRYTYKGIPANDLPAVWAAEDRKRAAKKRQPA